MSNTKTFILLPSPGWLSNEWGSDCLFRYNKVLSFRLTEFFEQNILEPFMGDDLHPWVEDRKHVVCVLVPRIPADKVFFFDRISHSTLDAKSLGINNVWYYQVCDGSNKTLNVYMRRYPHKRSTSIENGNISWSLFVC